MCFSDGNAGDSGLIDLLHYPLDTLSSRQSFHAPSGKLLACSTARARRVVHRVKFPAKTESQELKIFNLRQLGNYLYSQSTNRDCESMVLQK
jgi:hypothetical protein